MSSAKEPTGSVKRMQLTCRQVYLGKDRRTGELAALKRVRMENETEGVHLSFKFLRSVVSSHSSQGNSGT